MAKKIIAWLLVVVLTAGIAIGGTLAYLTDRDSEANVFTTGDVDITLEEEFEQGSELLPGKDIEKNVQIKNEGPNDAYVWYTYAVPQGLEQGLILEFTEGTNWSTGALIGTKEVDGVTYNVYACKYNTAIAAGETTDVGLTKVTMDPAVDITPEGDAYLVVGGQTTSLNWNINNTENPVIFINAYAIQAEGFEDVPVTFDDQSVSFAQVDAAYNAFVGQWGDMIGAGTYDAPALTPGEGEEEPEPEPEPVMDPRVVYNGTTYDTLKAGVDAANTNGGGEITLLGSFDLTETVQITTDITLDGQGHTITRAASASNKNMFEVEGTVTLTTKDVTLDGGAIWTGDEDPILKRGTTNEGVKSSAAFISARGQSSMYLGSGTVLQNNDGDAVVKQFVGSPKGLLTLDGAKVINNNSRSTTVQAYSNSAMKNGAQISYNSTTGYGGGIKINKECRFDMYDGEISHNKAEEGGALYAFANTNSGTAYMNLMGGRISENYANDGGVVGAYAHTQMNISGAEIIGNTAYRYGFIEGRSTIDLNMTGGKVSGNVANDPTTDKIDLTANYGFDISITGGIFEGDYELETQKSITLGGDGIKGILTLPAKAVNLTADFGTIQFRVTAGGNTDAFSFKPASGYTYTAGDEAKLVCLNEGYSTYWDAATSTFKIQAN